MSQQRAQAVFQTKQKNVTAMASRSSILHPAAIIPALTPVHSGVLQRCSNGVECADCRAKRLERESLQRAAVSASAVPPIVHDVLNSPGHPLDAGARTFMEPRFGHDFSGVRVHTDARAAESARSVNALAYTVGKNVVFGTGHYAPGTGEGRRLLAHELTHVVQQGNKTKDLNTKLAVSATNDASEQEADAIADIVMRKGQVGTIRSELSLGSTQLQRVPCLPDAICKAPTALHPDASAPIVGSAEAFGARVETAEEAARKRRGKMTPARARAHGHGGKATALEWFLDNQSPGLRTNIHGIFVDQDMDRNVEATTEPCDQFVPPILGATKPCVFVHGHLNQEAFTFIKEPHKPIIGRLTREDWRVQTLQTLTHEIQHIEFDNEFGAIMSAFEGLGIVKASVTCSRDDVEQELTELSAIMSAFPIAFRAIPPGADPANAAHTRLNHWFRDTIDNPDESIRGSLTKMRCKCSCPDANRHVIETFIFTSVLWSQAEKDAFNAELRKPVWHLDWPL